MGNGIEIRLFSQFFVSVNPHIFEVPTLSPIFFGKLYGTVRNAATGSFNRPNVYFTIFRTILWMMKQELGDFLHFSCMLVMNFLWCNF